MANVKISALPAATTVASADVLPIVQSATTKKATFQVLSDALGVTSTVANSSSGLVFISNTTIGSGVSTVTVSNVFSSAYDNYKIVWKVASQSATANAEIYLSGSGSNYYTSGYWQAPTSSTMNFYSTGASPSSIAVVGVWQGSLAQANGSCDVYAPFLSERTYFINASSAPGYYWWSQAQAADTASSTGFTFRPSAGTITGGTITVYGYRK